VIFAAIRAAQQRVIVVCFSLPLKEQAGYPPRVRFLLLRNFFERRSVDAIERLTSPSSNATAQTGTASESHRIAETILRDERAIILIGSY
jgi:hypothetical protein